VPELKWTRHRASRPRSGFLIEQQRNAQLRGLRPQPMLRQMCIGVFYQPKQRAGVAAKVQVCAEQLAMVAKGQARMFAEWIKFALAWHEISI
jgi:hypothetical protein